MTSVRNTLAIAGKELRGYFASPMGYILIGLFALLFGAFFRVYLTGFAEQSQRAAMGGGGNINVNEYADSRRAPQRRHHHPLRDADDHDADLRRGEAVGHDGAAAHVAA